MSAPEQRRAFDAMFLQRGGEGGDRLLDHDGFAVALAHRRENTAHLILERGPAHRVAAAVGRL